MLVTVYVVVPNRGSVRVLFKTIWRSAEYHRSETTWRAFSFPICPAGMVCVVRVPSATRPLIVCVPSDSFFNKPAASSCCNRSCIFPSNAGADCAFAPVPPWVWNADVRATLFSLSSMMCTPATGSEIETIVFAAPDAVSGPNPVNVASCRDLPWLSRYIVTCDVRWSTDPSCKVDVVSDVAVAENGAPLTTLPPCIPSKPINSIGAPKGGPSGPCLCACTAAALNTSAPLNTKHIFILGLILLSPLLSQTAALHSPRQTGFSFLPAPAARLAAAHHFQPANPLGSTRPRALRSPAIPAPQASRAAFARGRSRRLPSPPEWFPAAA